MLILRKDDTYEAGGITFTVRPERYTDGHEALEVAKRLCAENGLDPGGEKVMHVAVDMMFMLRIVSWDGVFQSEDEPAPCTTDAKIAFMGQQRQIFVDIQRQVMEREASVSKNSGTSQGGSETTEQTCATDADGTADAEKSPCPAKTEKTATRPHRDSMTASADSSGCSESSEAA